MSGLSYDIRLEAGTAEAALDAVAQRLEDGAPLTAKIAAYLESSTRDRFEAQHGPDGHPWKPSIRARLTGGLTLKASGQLLESITSAHSADQVEVGTNKVYGPLMHFGGWVVAKTAKALRFKIPGVGWRSAQKVYVPGRPYLGIDGDDREEIGEIISGYLAQAAPS